ncbi:hypothetical protein DL96DRAFT_1468914 [Flagelloscypha sp. PMI_526]|nr:hypothetical protein DL96DRAFT_1468914 [Flagelloscypha sp. PMI_526]
MERDFPIPTYEQALEVDVPSYSSKVLDGEQSLISIPRTGQRRVAPTGKFERSSGHLTVILDAQSPCADQPTYGLNSVISGNVKFNKKTDDVVDVVIKLSGKMDMVISEAGAMEETLFSETFPLWSAHDASTSGQRCAPTTLPFSLPMPNEYLSGDVLKSLPPSLESQCLTSPALFAKVRYELSIHVDWVPKLGGLVSKKKRLDIPFTYLPRMRPFRPILDNPDFLQTVKTAPEEWTEIPAQLEPTDNSKPVHFFIPTAKIYALSDTIPFHIQLTGAVSHLSEFLPPSYTEPYLNAPPKKKRGRPAHDVGEPTIKVELIRQIVADIRGIRTFKNLRIGHGQLLPLPQARALPCNDCEIALDWMGSLTAESEISFGGFTTGNLTMKDFVMLTITPSCNSNFKNFKLPVSVRLVTDPWIDTTSRDDHDALTRERTR